MIFFEKTQPGPECLKKEAKKKAGDYKCGNVLEMLKHDFSNKCYICESKEPVSINVEHFRPHKGDIRLKFNWNNLFWSCSHCNNTKQDRFHNILNCTDPGDDVETGLKYSFKPFPHEKVKIEVMSPDERTQNTRDLLLDVYNGTTRLKQLESWNLREKLLDEVMRFQKSLVNYFKDTNDDENRKTYLREIKAHLHKASNFTAFKRWIIRGNEKLLSEFKDFI